MISLLLPARKLVLLVSISQGNVSPLLVNQSAAAQPSCTHALYCPDQG